MSKKHKIVEISWRDPSIWEGWVDPIVDPHDKELPLFKSYGILVEKDKNQIVIAGGYVPEDGHYCDRSIFPVGCVKNLRVIEEVKL